MTSSTIPVEEQMQIADDIGQYAYDPAGFVYHAYDWGEGDLAGEAGPRAWQLKVLRQIGEHLSNSETRHTPCQIAISSGHDVGKSALVSWITNWALSTFDGARGTITANTKTQLDTKTQPEISKWFRLAINADWWNVNVTSVKTIEDALHDEWRIDLVPWSEDNPAAAAGLHNKNKRLLIIFDEASEIPQVIFETAEGVTLDEHTEIIWLIAGNPTINFGPFYDAVFGITKHRWKTHVIDSRDVAGTNKAKLKQWEEDNGEDSDFFRVRARGLAPRSNSGQFIDQETIDAAQRRPPVCLPDDPLVAGVDFAWGGPDDNVVRFRKGYYGNCVPPIKVKGAQTRDPAVMVGKLADVLSKTYVIDGVPQKVAMLFLDSAGIAAPVEARLRQLGYKNLCIVNYGADSPKPECAYMRDYIWNEAKKWLAHGSIGKDAMLAADFAKPLLVSDKHQRIKLESKEEMIARLRKLGIKSGSPDDADSFNSTFAMPVAPVKKTQPSTPKKAHSPWG